jgi:hypothetical protein
MNESREEDCLLLGMVTTNWGIAGGKVAELGETRKCPASANAAFWVACVCQLQPSPALSQFLVLAFNSSFSTLTFFPIVVELNARALSSCLPCCC